MITLSFFGIVTPRAHAKGRGLAIEGNVTTLIQVLDRFAAAEPRSARTIANYRWALAKFAGMGIRDVDDATVANVGRWIERRMAEVKPQSVYAELAAITTVVRYLASRGEVPRERVLELRALRPRWRRPRIFHARFHSRDEIDRLRAAARTQRTEGDAAELTIVLAVLSGLRLGELARLRWQDVDLERRVISVRLDASLGERGRIKTMRERLVPVCSELGAFLAPRHRGHGYIFAAGPRASVNAVSPTRTLWLRLVRARKRARIPDATFQTMRHTFCSWLVQAGVALARVAHFAGHAPEVTARFYAGITEKYDVSIEALSRGAP